MYEEQQFGAYRLVRRLAASGSSEVFLALTVGGDHAGERVVVKKLLPEIARIGVYVDLLQNEASLGRFLDHPNVVRIFEYGTVGSEIYLTMEYVDGLDLWRLMRRTRRYGRQLTQVQALYIAVKVLEALAYLHELRDDAGARLAIVHHDVSPSNVLIARTGEVKLGDFGISFARHKDIPESQRKLKFRGKVHYVSPEQIKGQPADLRSDIFSVGVLLTELLTGKKPYEGPTDLSILINIKDSRSPLLDEMRETLPGELHAVVAKALANDPAGRFQTCREMHERIVRFAGKDAVEAARDGVGETVSALIGELERGPTTKPPPVPLAGTSAAEALETRTPVVFSSPPPPPAQADAAREYQVKKASGEMLGALDAAAIVEKIAAGQLAEDDLAAAAGGPYRLLTQYPEFRKHLAPVTPTAQVHDVGLPDRMGILGEEENVLGVFMDLYRKKATGLLIFECGSIRKEIYVEEGAPSYASSNEASELLGEFLVKRGYIKRMELDLALAMIDKFNGHLGDTLINLNILDSITLLNAITEQIKGRIFDIFTWKNGSYAFYRNARYLKDGFRLAADPLELIRDAAVEAFGDAETAAWYDGGEKYKVLSLAPGAGAAAVDEWKIETPYRQALLQMEKPRPLCQVVDTSPLRDEKGNLRLRKLVRFGLAIGFIKEVM